eukprot:m.11464 g.11464  ORF g.11464 m.11464 type:complete len:67 (+) comp15520_c0_seq1:182-382(+)
MRCICASPLVACWTKMDDTECPAGGLYCTREDDEGPETIKKETSRENRENNKKILVAATSESGKHR